MNKKIFFLMLISLYVAQSAELYSYDAQALDSFPHLVLVSLVSACGAACTTYKIMHSRHQKITPTVEKKDFRPTEQPMLESKKEDISDRSKLESISEEFIFSHIINLDDSFSISEEEKNRQEIKNKIKDNESFLKGFNALIYEVDTLEGQHYRFDQSLAQDIIWARYTPEQREQEIALALSDKAQAKKRMLDDIEQRGMLRAKTIIEDCFFHDDDMHYKLAEYEGGLEGEKEGPELRKKHADTAINAFCSFIGSFSPDMNEKDNNTFKDFAQRILKEKGSKEDTKTASLSNVMYTHFVTTVARNIALKKKDAAEAEERLNALFGSSIKKPFMDQILQKNFSKLTNRYTFLDTQEQILKSDLTIS